MNRYRLYQSAAKLAIKYRVHKRIPNDEPCDIYDIIKREGLDLQFMDVPSLEGMYLAEPESERICICAQRPWGRQRFTAAHELGHHLYGHGTQVDQAIEQR